jgi:hypothetical protein
MKKSLLLIMLAVVLSCGRAATASSIWTGQVGTWAEPNKWTGDGEPNGASEVVIRSTGTQCTLDTNAGDWSVAQRLRVCADANLVIAQGGELLGVSWVRIGTPEGPGRVIQTGGLVKLKGAKDGSKLTIGYEKGSKGSDYTISGGAITYLDSDGYIIVGYRGGEGTFTVVGTAPKIEMRKLYVGGDIGDKAGTGNLQFKTASDGVSSIKLSNNIYLNRHMGPSKANLIVTAVAEPPKADIPLIEDTGFGVVDGTFDTVTDANGTKEAAEGAAVMLKFGDKVCNYILTYKYDASKDGGNNDVALVYQSQAAEVPQQGAKTQ